MKFMRILSGCPEGAGKWRILVFSMLWHSKKMLAGGSSFSGGTDGELCKATKSEIGRFVFESANLAYGFISGSFR